MLQDVGIAKTVAYAQNLGIGTLPSVPSLALGAGEVTLMSMTSAYSAFANGGVLNHPSLIRRVEDADGKLLYEAKPDPKQVVSPRTAYLMTSMLSDVVNYGTAYRARQEGFTLPAGGKTGTTNDFVDAWFVGFTPKIVTGVWIGFDQPKTILPNGFAGDLAVPLWARFMKDATAGAKPEWFSAPKGLVAVQVCRVSGLLPGQFCDRVVTEYFQREAVPTEICHSHGIAIDGTLATIVSPQQETLPPPPAVAEVPPARTQHASIEPPPANEDTIVDAPEKPKKRGFWGKLFGRGKEKNSETKNR
jgi:penicillin-binding protein 1A